MLNLKSKVESSYVVHIISYIYPCRKNGVPVVQCHSLYCTHKQPKVSKQLDSRFCIGYAPMYYQNYVYRGSEHKI